MIAVSTALQWLALSSLFASRAFAPAAILVIACRLSLGGELDPAWLTLPAQPRAWFREDDVALAVGALALVEWGFHHMRGTRRVLVALDVYYKPLVAAFTYVGLGLQGDGTLLRRIGAEVVIDTLRFEPNVPAVLIFLATWMLASLQKSAHQRLARQDPGDELRLQRTIAWAEDAWTLLFVPAFLVTPAVVLAGALPMTFAAWSVRRALRVNEEEDKVICVCGQLNYRSAVRCAGCGGRNDAPLRVGFFGQATAEVAPDPLQQSLALFEVKRCARCASHLVGSGPRQFCGACGSSAASDEAFLDDYDMRIRTRAIPALFASAVLAAVPVVGTIPAVFHAQRRLIAPYTRYSRPRSIFARALLRMAWLAIVLVTLVPGAGLVAMPLMAFLAHRVQRAAFRRDLTSDDDFDGFGAFSTSH